MGKCQRCGRRGLFLKILPSGFCKSCAEQLKNSIPDLVDIFLGPPANLPAPPLPPKEVSGYVVAENGEYLSKTSVQTFLNLDGLHRVDNCFYTIAKTDVERVSNDIMGLNRFLKKASELFPEIPKTAILKNSLQFEKTHSEGGRDYTIVCFASSTKTGRSPKYPVRVYFHASKKLWGNIFYGINGSVGKAEIIYNAKLTRTVMGDSISQNLTTYIIKVATIQDELRLSLIYRKIGEPYSRIKLYDAKR